MAKFIYLPVKWEIFNNKYFQTMENQTNPVQAPEQQAAPQPKPQTIYIQQPAQPNQGSNGLGIAGFVVSLCAAFLVWVPFLNLVLSIVGLILSAMGMKKLPKGLATAGLVISIIFLVISLIWVITVLLAASAVASYGAFDW